MPHFELPDEKTRELFAASYRRCTQNRSFMQRFYDIFVGSSPAIAAKFEHTDMRHQARMVQVSLVMLLAAVEGRDEGLQHLERIAKIHGRAQHDIPAAMYESWLDCLLQAVREYDPYCQEQVEQAWRTILAPGIEYLKAHYDQPVTDARQIVRPAV